MGVEGVDVQAVVDFGRPGSQGLDDAGLTLAHHHEAKAVQAVRITEFATLQEEALGVGAHVHEAFDLHEGDQQASPNEKLHRRSGFGLGEHGWASDHDVVEDGFRALTTKPLADQVSDHIEIEEGSPPI